MAALALRVTPTRLRSLLSLLDQFSSIQNINRAITSVRVTDKNALFSTSTLLDVESGPFANVSRAMRDSEQNVLVSAEAMNEFDFRPVAAMQLEVFLGYIEASGYTITGDHWRSSALWPSALLHALLSVAPEHERPGVFERLVAVSPEVAVEVLERGIRWDYPVRSVAPRPFITEAAAAHLLQSSDPQVRELAITHLSRVRSRSR